MSHKNNASGLWRLDNCDAGMGAGLIIGRFLYFSPPLKLRLSTPLLLGGLALVVKSLTPGVM